MKIFGLFITLFCSQYLFAQYNWVSQTSGTNQVIRSFDFLSDDLGFAVCNDGIILKTVDYGENWVQVYDVDEEPGYSLSDNLMDVVFKDASNAMVFAHFGKILTSNDGGFNWNTVYNGPNGDNIYDAATSNDRVIVGRFNDVLITDDFGATWDSVDVDGISLGVFGIDFAPSGGVGVACGQNGELGISNDGGNSWAAITGAPTAYDLHDVYVFDSGKFIAVGDSGTVILSNDGGSSWDNVSIPTSFDHFYSIDFADNDRGVIAGQDGAVFETSDGGLTWVISPNTGLTTFFKAYVTNSYRGWLGGDQGTILGSPSFYYTVDIVEYLGPDSTCFNTPFDFSFKFINQGPGEMINPPFSILIGTHDLFGGQVSYPGIVPPGDSAVFTISATHDAIGATGNQPITIYAVIPPTFVGGFVNEDTIFFTDYVPHSVVGDTLFCPGDTINLEADGGNSYNWTSSGAQVADPSASDQEIIIDQPTIFYVEIEQDYCTIFDSINVKQDPFCDTSLVDSMIILTPTEAYAFSPNDDGVNDTFVIDFLEDYTLNNVYIYNRWGDEVAFFSNYNNNDVVWDGTHYGFGRVPVGTYYFLIETLEPNASYKGWVQVVK
jgi:gliding motility-associated-like protein